MNAISGLELKVLRIRADLRQYKLAAQLGITQTKLSEIECGRAQPSNELLQRILGIIQEKCDAKAGKMPDTCSSAPKC